MYTLIETTNIHKISELYAGWIKSQDHSLPLQAKGLGVVPFLCLQTLSGICRNIFWGKYAIFSNKFKKQTTYSNFYTIIITIYSILRATNQPFIASLNVGKAITVHYTCVQACSVFRKTDGWLQPDWKATLRKCSIQTCATTRNPPAARLTLCHTFSDKDFIMKGYAGVWNNFCTFLGK